MKTKDLSKYGLLFFSVIVYSCCSLFSKLASDYTVFSWQFVLFYGLSILVLAIYAVLWQHVLKQFELSVAYSSKPISMLLSMVWGIALFHEQLTWNMILGAVIIVLGIRMVVTDGGN